jgi:hypothetical protein
MWFKKIKKLSGKHSHENENSFPDEESLKKINDYQDEADASRKDFRNDTSFPQPEFLEPEDTGKQYDPEEKSSTVEFKYLEELIQFRLGQYFHVNEYILEPRFPRFHEWESPMGSFLIENKLSQEEAILLLAGLVPHVQPDLFDKAIERKLPDSRQQSSTDLPIIGGVRGKNSRFFLPTGETVLFLIAGNDLRKRLDAHKLFGAEHLFAEKKILWLEELPQGEPPMSGRITLSLDYIDTFIYGKPTPPHFSMTFPARRIKENRKWDALIINTDLRRQVHEITNWLKYNDDLMTNWGMGDRVKRGYRALFYGPPGTGKTLTAGLLGNEIERDVYKIDLSMVVSKFIGETEKNLELLFARAEDKGWILFFDEADALFGKRTDVRDAHDKYANQEVSYLLQRIEDFNGLIILATNMKGNIDSAFLRRFNAILKFSLPDANDRLLIWEKSFPTNSLFVKETVTTNGLKLEKVSLANTLKNYELTGGSIINVVHYASIKAIEASRKDDPPIYYEEAEANPCSSDTAFLRKTLTPNDTKIIYITDVLEGIKRELSKEGKPFK